MNDSVVAIVSAFFLMGITVGIIAVVAMSALRAERRTGPSEYGLGGRREQRPDWDDTLANDPPRLPGGVGSDLHDR